MTFGQDEENINFPCESNLKPLRPVLLELEQTQSLDERVDSESDNGSTTTTPPSFTTTIIPVDVEPASTQKTNTIQPKKKKVTQQVVLEMQYEVLKTQKQIILLKNEKLMLQVAQLKKQANGSTLMSSLDTL